MFAHPKGFELDPAQIAHAKDNVARYGGSFTETDDMKEAFKDADLVGIPYRLTIGKKLKEGAVELFHRASRQVEEIPLGEAIERVVERIRA